MAFRISVKSWFRKTFLEFSYFVEECFALRYIAQLYELLAVNSLVRRRRVGGTYFDHVRNESSFFYNTKSKRFSCGFVALAFANDHPLEHRCVKQDPVRLMSAHNETSCSIDFVSVFVGWGCNNVELEIALAAFFPDFIPKCV